MKPAHEQTTHVIRRPSPDAQTTHRGRPRSDARHNRTCGWGAPEDDHQMQVQDEERDQQ